MNNEVMAKAISGIDDELIAQAYSRTAVIHKSRSVQRILAVAACLAVVVSSVFYIKSRNELDILIYSSKITDAPIAVETPSTAGASRRTAQISEVTIPVEIASKGSVDIKASAGEIEVFRPVTDELLYSGSSFSGKAPVAVFWSLENLDINLSYELRINGDKAILLLSYDSSANHWIIHKNNQEVTK